MHSSIRSVLLLTISIGVLSGCANSSGAYMGLTSATAPVIGILSDDLFTGTAVGYMNRTGTIDIVSAVNPDLRCIGTFRYTGSKVGEGKMSCNDGNEAKFQFKGLTMLSGYGFGGSTRGGLSFTFGLTPEEAAQYLKVPKGKRLVRDNKGKPDLSQI